MIPLPCTGWWQFHHGKTILICYSYTARFSFVKPFFSIFLEWVYHYIAFEKEEYQLLILLCLRHFLGSLCPGKTNLFLFICKFNNENNAMGNFDYWKTQNFISDTTEQFITFSTEMHFDVQYKERAFSNAQEIFRPALQCLGNLQASNSRFQGLKENKKYASIPFTKTVQDPQATPGKCEKKKNESDILWPTFKSQTTRQPSAPEVTNFVAASLLPTINNWLK